MFEVGETPLRPREAQLLARLQREYTPLLLREVLVPLVEQTSMVSLRVLDWTVVNWTKQHNVICTTSEGGMVNIHEAYRATLAIWKRRLFDPFRRRNRITVCVDGKEYETTLGQAHFILWAHTTGTLAYTLGNLGAIEASMNLVAHTQKRRRVEADAASQKRRAELTTASHNSCLAYFCPVRVEFE